MLSYRTVEPHTLELLKALMQLQILQPLRLVGGTSLALQYGHRQSVDIDLFGQAVYDAEELCDQLRPLGRLSVLKESTNIKIYTIDGIKIDIINYQYPWLRPELLEDGIRLAAPEDIAAMKVNAIVGRGTKKDFIDMYFLLQNYTLDEIWTFYLDKYSEKSLLRAIMSMTYFEDAEPQLMPRMFNDVKWNRIKATIKQAVMDYRLS